MDASEGALPRLSDERVDAMEEAVFARIGATRERGRRRRRWAASVVGVAAVVVLAAAVVSPLVVGALRPVESSVALAPAVGEATEPGSRATEGALPSVAVDGAAPAERTAVASAFASVTVDSARDAVRIISDDAVARGGYVESTTIAADRGAPASASTAIFPPLVDSVTVRVPSADLPAAVAALAAAGEVTSSTVNRSDVTTVQTDLRARVAAQEASVARLVELISGAGSTADLIAAESALADRQAALESDRQQLARLESDVALSSLTVQLSPRAAGVTADPAGFLDGVAAGWTGFVAALNGLAVGIGFLLPWLGVAALVLLAVAAIRAVRRRRRSGRPPVE